MSLPLLNTEIGKHCTRCTLQQFRTQVVFGEGPEDAKIMIVGEAPGADEDVQGRPFVGASGRRLNLWLEKLGIPREKVYISNICKCRPLNNRKPEPNEVATCSSFLRREIALIRPRLIMALGATSGKFLASAASAATLKWMRTQEFFYQDGELQVPLGVTYHPSYELQYDRDGSIRQMVMEDFERALRRAAPEQPPAPVPG